MTVDDRRHAATPRGWRVLAGGLVAALAFGYASLGVTAQDATPAASPAAADCVAPELPPGSPTPQDEMASPAAEMELASPVAEGEAPAAPEAPVGTPAEGAEGDEIVAAAQAVVDCVNAGDYEGAAALLSTAFMVSSFGSENPYDAVIALDGQTFADAVIDSPKTYEDGTVSAEIQYQGSQYQITKETWTLVDEDGTWKLQGFTPLTPDFDGDIAVVGVALGENEDGTYFITPNVESVVNAEGIILHGQNGGAEAHEIVAFILPEGADPAGLLDGSIAEEDTTFVGQITVAPGGDVDLLLVGLPEGVITLACFFPGPDGAPHAMNGMISQLEITAAA